MLRIRRFNFRISNTIKIPEKKKHTRNFKIYGVHPFLTVTLIHYDNQEVYKRKIIRP